MGVESADESVFRPQKAWRQALAATLGTTFASLSLLPCLCFLAFASLLPSINKVGIDKVGINKVGMLQGAIFKVAVTQMDSRLLLRLGTILSKVEGGCKWKFEKSKKERKTDTFVVLRGRQVLM